MQTETIRETTMMSQKAHMRNKDMWAGSQKKAEKQFYTVFHDDKSGKPKFKKTKLTYTPALYKTIDEIIVNAVDHVTNYPTQVTYIKIIFDIQNGIVQVINNGPGIPIYRVEITRDKNGEPSVRHLKDTDKPSDNPMSIVKWFPQWISEEPLTGNNLDQRKVHITGGVNGAGMKLTNYLSEFFTIETVDLSRRKHYYQVMEKGSNIIHDPIITSLQPNMNESFTKITFKPDYKFLDYPNPGPNDYYIIEQLIKTRAYQVAGYCKVDVHFQGQILNVKNITDLGEMFAPDLKSINIGAGQLVDDDDDDFNETKSEIVIPAVTLQLDSMPTDNKPKFNKRADKKIEVQKRTYVYSATLKSEKNLDDLGNHLLWNVCIGPSMSERFDHMSVVNGMYIVEGGSHINWLIEQVASYFEIEIKKITDLLETTMQRIKNNLYIVMVGPISNIRTDAQTKEKIINKPSDFDGYKFTNKQLKEIWKMCEGFVLSNILEDGVGKKKRKRPSLDKYRAAKLVKTKAKNQCSLFVPEGDSASNLIDGALTDKSLPRFNYNYYGYYNIQGVPMNARNFSKILINPKTNEKTILYSEAIHDNERLEGLYCILGLDEKKTYDFTLEGEKDYASLNYGSVILATDQDHDGKGNITSLIINYFMVFWPNLVKRGFLKRLNTPIIRTINKSSDVVKSFNSISGFESWRQSSGISNEIFDKTYETKYYKGLALHGEDDIKDIFNNFDRNLHIYTLDERSEKLFEEYFGRSSQHRKTHLRTPVDIDFPETARIISVSDHLAIDTKAYKRYKITCMLPHVNDGMLITRRKIFAAARFVMNESQTMNVSALGGRVRADMHHHHGDSAITDSITKMGQEFFPRLIPLFLGNSIAKGFGSRKFGGHNAGQPRYLEVKQNIKVTKLLFPIEDDWILPYEFEEGQRCEPKYYLPILPMVLLETQHHPAHGWDIKTWARDWKTVIRNIRRAIQSFEITQIGFNSSNIIEAKISQNINNGSTVIKFNDDKLLAPLEFMPMDTTNWNGKMITVQVPSADPSKPPVTKLYSVGSYVYDEKTNTICITELPHGISSDNFAYGNRKLIEKRKEEFDKAEKKLKDDAKKRWEAEHAQIVIDASKLSLNDTLKTEKKKRGKDKKTETVMSYDSLMKMSSIPDVSKQFLADAKKKRNLLDAEHGNELINELALDLNSVPNNDEFHWESKKFNTKALVDREYVKTDGVYDESTDKQIEIYVELEPGSYKKIMENGVDHNGKEFLDGVIEHFKLRVVIHDNLNLIDGDSGYIREYKEYDEVFRSWFIERKKLYEARFKRRLIIHQLQIYKLELIQKFCEESKNGVINISRKPRVIQEQILLNAKYPKIGTSIINNPKYTPIDKIKYEALENPNNLDYHYILDITQGQLSEESYAERNEKIKNLNEEINNLANSQKYFLGANWWLEELAKIEPVIEKGLTEGWGYDQRKKKYS